ncbi:putative nucleic acid-binding Zn ribbon protein [Clavibacter sp. B3I6]|uniref:hypothetical protein n=1 Tax=Clavibacter sp. B3I6 TaxID=3042268 RepID=UPI0027886868|nr:hypothetical protein [Clavibacter sp. B3I6]MDQ0743388.1 putative nucleic acid-binding Zn ribbon protein [Clavibacter sp. B3I6]
MAPTHARTREHTCVQCGQTFDAVRFDARMCSGACRQARYRERDRETVRDLTVAVRALQQHAS